MKKQAFLENAKLLSQKLDIVPLLYGSLGLEYLTGENLNADDIDILIPEIFLYDRWLEFREVLAQHGYLLTDEREHTFQKDGIAHAYASVEELESFAGISLSDIRQYRENGIVFRLLSLEQYQKVYTASAKDGYRVEVRQKKDSDKLALIQKYMLEISQHERRTRQWSC